ncbi:MAG: DUF3501 family protein [Kiloniellales bacterium]|nr:DUF3501 family protein [Kiloniellales bacterium]MDJ0983288.1 DUF3501 family protein [Kiloniellales bacterium]
MANKHEITYGDILAPETYAAERKVRRSQMVEVKRHRRIEVGPVCTFYFENYETMWHQVHEMLFIEKGGEEQIEDELLAYNPLIPKGSELVATVMFEIDDPIRRKAFLSRLGGVEETAFLEFAGHRVVGTPEADVDRTTADGKASSVQFIHFILTAEQISAFRAANTQVVIGFDHPAYGHMSVMPEAVRDALAKDFD